MGELVPLPCVLDAAARLCFEDGVPPDARRCAFADASETARSVWRRVAMERMRAGDTELRRRALAASAGGW